MGELTKYSLRERRLSSKGRAGRAARVDAAAPSFPRALILWTITLEVVVGTTAYVSHLLAGPSAERVLVLALIAFGVLAIAVFLETRRLRGSDVVEVVRGVYARRLPVPSARRRRSRRRVCRARSSRGLAGKGSCVPRRKRAIHRSPRRA